MLQIGRIRGDGARQTFLMGAVLGASTLLLSVCSVGTVHAEAVNCDANAVIAGGVASVTALQQKYTSGTSCVAGGVTHGNKAYSIQDIYHAFGMAPSDISAMSSDAQEGYVTKSGDVYVGGTLVATGAYTAGRQNIAGSTAHHYGETTYYQRPTNVSFQDSQLSAIVVMKNGVFAHAVLHSCGNPVNATPVPKKTLPPPKTPAPKPFYECVQLTGAILDKSKMSFSFTADAGFGGGATFTSADFDFGDGTSKKGVKPVSGSTSVTVQHTYSSASTFNASAVLHFSAASKAVTAAACAARVTPTTPPTPECKPGVPVGSAACNPCPTDSSLPVESPDCQTPPPPQLPNTGAGDVIAIFGAVVVAGFLVYRQIIFRRHRAAFLAAERGTSPLPLADPLNETPQPVVTPRTWRRRSLRRKRPY